MHIFAPLPVQVLTICAAAAADRDAQVLDFVQFNRRAALNSSLKHSACSYLPPKDAVTAADEAIHMYPFDLSPQCEVGWNATCDRTVPHQALLLHTKPFPDTVS